VLLPAAAGLLAAVALLAVSGAPVRLAPGRGGWTRLVGNVTDGGVIPQAGLVRLPGLDRTRPALLIVAAEAAGGGPAALGLAVDAGPLQWVRTSAGAPAAVVLPPARAPGARVALRRAEGAAAPRIAWIRVQRESEPRRPWPAAIVAFIAAAAAAGGLSSRLGREAAFALGLFTGAAVALTFAPALLWMTLPSAPSLLRLAAPALLVGMAAWFAARQPAVRRRELMFGAAVVAAFVFGAWVRAWLMPSAGSWDTEYWKGWTVRMGHVGLTRVYGEPEPFAWRRFLALMHGQEPLTTVGHGLTIDYPPLTMMLLRTLSAFSTPAPAGLDGSEAQNVVVKTLPVLGDVGAVIFLLLAFRRTPSRALGLAALYWALPPSWLSSAVLGFIDGAYVPLSAAALWMAGRGRAGWAGALLALAALVKATALLVAPAAAMALWAARAPIRRAVGAGLAVVATAMIPFVLGGTAPLAIAQVYRIIFQRTLSGGFANLWWIAGQGVAVSTGGDWTAPVRFVRQDEVSWPVGPIGITLFALATVFILRAQRAVPGPRAAALAGAALVLAYGLFALGVHENHPHAMILLMMASGLASRLSRVIFAGVAASYTLNMLALSGLGRFYGPRHMLIEPLAPAWPALRSLPGFDLTLLLAVANLLLFAALLTHLPHELRRAQAGGSGYDLAA
jgi:hypothetical protein